MARQVIIKTCLCLLWIFSNFQVHMYVFDLNNSMWCSQKNTLKLKVRLIYFYEISLYFLQQKKGSMIFYSWIMIFEKRKQQQWNCLTFFLPIFCKRHEKYFRTVLDFIACCQSKNHLLRQIYNFIFVDRWSCFTFQFLKFKCNDDKIIFKWKRIKVIIWFIID